MYESVGDSFVGFEGEASGFPASGGVIIISWLVFPGGNMLRLAEKLCNTEGWL